MRRSAIDAMEWAAQVKEERSDYGKQSGLDYISNRDKMRKGVEHIRQPDGRFRRRRSRQRWRAGITSFGSGGRALRLRVRRKMVGPIAQELQAGGLHCRRAHTQHNFGHFHRSRFGGREVQSEWQVMHRATMRLKVLLGQAVAHAAEASRDIRTRLRRRVA